VAELLRDYLKGRPAGERIWGGAWARNQKGAEMLRRDLEAAGIPYAVEGPDGPLYADFHALRHTYLTLLSRGGVDLRTSQELAGHSTPELTANYSHVRLHDVAGAVEKMPDFLPEGNPQPSPEALRATGTEGASPGGPVGLVVPRVVPTPAVSGRGVSEAVGTGEQQGDGGGGEKPLQDGGLDASCRELSGSVGERPLPDSNRGWRICNPLPYHLAKGPAGERRGMVAARLPRVNGT
jgi:hypothetical protein